MTEDQRDGEARGDFVRLVDWAPSFIHANADDNAVMFATNPSSAALSWQRWRKPSA